jgi:hypothetical protein
MAAARSPGESIKDQRRIRVLPRVEVVREIVGAEGDDHVVHGDPAFRGIRKARDEEPRVSPERRSIDGSDRNHEVAVIDRGEVVQVP